jgi:hypothetical protein
MCAVAKQLAKVLNPGDGSTYRISHEEDVPGDQHITHHACKQDGRMPVNCSLRDVSNWSQEVRVGSTHILYHDGVILLCKQIFRSTWRPQIQSNPKGVRAVSSVRFHVCEVGA